MRSQPNATHVSCLEVVGVRWNSGESQVLEDWGNLLEIWPLGGIIHVGKSIPVGTVVAVKLPGGEISAKVQSTQQDEFGFYLELRVKKPWFPHQYQPIYQLPHQSVERLRAS